jgi:polar amino acid transport system substrate-binding protein
MKRVCSLFLALVGGLLAVQLSVDAGAAPVQAEGSSAPTLVPPTLVPTPIPAGGDTLATESTIGLIQRDGRVRVGILFNAPPFGELNIRGEVSGVDADLARSMATAWDVEVEFVQVTRQTGLEMLVSGKVDMLIASQVHRRELDPLVEFSQTYYLGSQSLMVRADDPAVRLSEMANRIVGAVIGSDGERAMSEWVGRTNLVVDLRTYLTLDRAYVGLVEGEVDGVVASRVQLLRAATQPDLVRILDDPVSPEPYAIVMLRQDANMRSLVNRTLQYLTQSGRVEEIHQADLPGVSFPIDTIPLWAGIGEEAPKPAQFSTEIAYPAQYVVPRLLNSQALRVAGVSNVPEDAPESQRRLELLNRALIEQMAERWGVRVEYIPDSAASALDMVAAGQADIAIGVQPDWGDRVDFTGPYLLHGERLMITAGSEIDSFVGLRGGTWVATPSDEPTAAARAVELATSVNARVEIFQTREHDIAFSILSEKNADVAFGDSLALADSARSGEPKRTQVNR